MGSTVSNNNIHPTAIVEDGARIHPSVAVGPYAVIGAEVEIGAGSTVGAHCVIEGHTTIGEDNRIFQFASLGAAPQDKKYGGEDTRLVIGHRNTIREFCTFNLGTAQDKGVTTIGDDNWIMAYVHIAHDCVVGNRTILANNATLAGHVQVADQAIIGGLTGIHQFVKVGAHVMAGFASHISQDVPPFMMVDGNPLAVRMTDILRDSFAAYFRLKRFIPNHEEKALIWQQHADIYDAVRGRSPQRARDAMIAHLDFVESKLAEGLEEFDAGQQ